MHFELTEQQIQVRDTIRAFAEKEIAPHAGKWDEEHRFPIETVRAIGKLGALGIVVPEKYGGAGLDYVSYALVVEETARWDGSFALTVASHNGLGQGHILAAGTEEQKRRYIPDLASGRKLAAWGLTEPGSGSDAAGMKTTAVRKGDRWILNGAKMFITQGFHGDVYVVLAVTDKSKGSHGVSAFIVEKGWKGFKQIPIKHKLGMNSSDTAELVFEDVEVPDENRLGTEGEGFIDTLKILDRGRVSIGALGVGIIRGCLEESVKYAKQRTAFGKPIAEFQAMQWMIADMGTALEASRLLVLRAAKYLDDGRPAGVAASMAKLFASEAAMKASTQAVQIHGGYGYTKEFMVERHFRDAKLLEIGEGTSEIQRLVISRSITGSR
ncbi:MAG: Acyl-CoA dehydrogenase [Myxococcota bacterium]|nr:Acyl-CoA dehydrogenase [Myxococcota bacterium]